MLKDLSSEVILLLMQKDFVLFAPKSKRGLKVDYPELGDSKKHPEFSGLNMTDMLFVWAWACASSPLSYIKDRAEKLDVCTTYAYSKEHRARKAAEYAVRFDEGISRALKKMEKFSLTARVEEYIVLRMARENYKFILSQDIRGAQDEERESWVKQAKEAQKALAEQRERIEGLDLGIAEAGDTLIGEAFDILSAHHQLQN